MALPLPLPLPLALACLLAAGAGTSPPPTEAEAQAQAAAAPAPEATPAPPASAVVVLKTGKSMVVRSYRVDGRQVKIVGTDGEPMVLRADLLDLDRSEQASRKHAEDEAQRAEAAAAAAEAEAEAHRKAIEANETHRAKSHGGGGWNVAPGDAGPGDAGLAEPMDAGGDGPRSLRGGADDEKTSRKVAFWTPKFAELEKKRSALAARQHTLVLEYNKTVEDVKQMSVNAPAQANVRMGRLDEIRKEIEGIRTELSGLRTRYEKLKKDALNDGVPEAAFSN